MNLGWIFYTLVPLIALAQFSVHGLPASIQSKNGTTQRGKVKSTTVARTPEIKTDKSIVDKKNKAVVKAKGGGVVAGSVKKGDGFAKAVNEGKNNKASVKLQKGDGAISAATGDGKAMSLNKKNTKITMAKSKNGTAVSAKGTGNATISGSASSGKRNEAKTSVRLKEAKASGSASGKGAASVSNVKGKSNSGSSSAASGNSQAMGVVKGKSNGFGEALGKLTIKGSKSGGGVASSGSATSGKAATSLSGSGGNSKKNNGKGSKGKRAGALAISTNGK